MKEKVKQINDLLRSFGNNAIQQDTIPGRGQVVGYKPQYVLDAINAVLGQENWQWEVMDQQVVLPNDQGKNGIVYIRIALFVRLDNGEWLKKGEHYGGARITVWSVGDALKSAVTDAIQKAFSTMSVARDSYSGLLKNNAGRSAQKRLQQQDGNRNNQSPPPPPATNEKSNLHPVPDARNPQGQDGFEELLQRGNSASAERSRENEAGAEINPAEYGLQPVKDVKFVKEGHYIVAKDVKSGASYFSRKVLGGMGFSFQGELKYWAKAI